MNVGPSAYRDTPQTTRSAGTNKPARPDSRAVSALGSAPAEDAEHSGSNYGDVYVNDLGRAAMFGKAAPNLPPGSMIGREKLSRFVGDEARSAGGNDQAGEGV